MAEKALLVGRIRHGTVLDHIDESRAFRVLKALNITGQDGNIVSVAVNVPSRKIGKKDIVKIENRFLSRDESNRIALIAPSSTVNIIRDHKVVEKRAVQLPEVFENVFKCPNPTCISNSHEPIKSIIRVEKRSPPVLRCGYCARLLTPNELEELV